jgi:hypothetical protein
MRAITVFVSASLLTLTGMTGCAGSAPPPKMADPITYNQADFSPPGEFDMSFAPQGVAQGPAIKRSEPAEASYKARVVTLEKQGE